MLTEGADVNAQILSFVFNGAVVVVIIVTYDNFLGLSGKDANIKADRLQFFDENLERFGNAGFGNILTFDNGLVSLDSADDIIGLDGKNFL